MIEMQQCQKMKHSVKIEIFLQKPLTVLMPVHSAQKQKNSNHLNSLRMSVTGLMINNYYSVADVTCCEKQRQNALLFLFELSFA